jgi:hypothetical protein
MVMLPGQVVRKPDRFPRMPQQGLPERRRGLCGSPDDHINLRPVSERMPVVEHDDAVFDDVCECHVSLHIPKS